MSDHHLRKVALRDAGVQLLVASLMWPRFDEHRRAIRVLMALDDRLTLRQAYEEALRLRRGWRA